VTEAEFASIQLKATDSLGPSVMFYRPGLPAGTISFYPRAAADVALSLPVLVQVSGFATLTTDIELPPGYAKAIVYSLAEECASDFERDVPSRVHREAANARNALHLVNFTVPQLMVDIEPSRLGQFLAG
jgi:hypothetical protein